jgi:hypothetical protein
MLYVVEGVAKDEGIGLTAVITTMSILFMNPDVIPQVLYAPTATTPRAKTKLIQSQIKRMLWRG